MASETQFDLLGVEEQLAELQSDKWLPSSGVDAVVEKLRALQGDEKAAASPSARAFVQVVEITREMFPCPVEIDVDCDPSDPEPPFVNLIVRVPEEWTEWRRLRNEWIDRVIWLDVDYYDMPRLLIYPQDER